MIVKIDRTYHKDGTNGILYVDGQQVCRTIELPWNGNKTGVSCIPPGRYKLAKRWSPKYKWHVHVLDVPNRFWILIHPANDAKKELRGCIAPVTTVAGPGRGWQSRPMFVRVRDIVFAAIDKKEEVWLEIGPAPNN